MRVSVEFRDDRVEFEVGDDRLVGAWSGPEGISGGALRERFRAALDDPIGYPPLRRNVVPGDHVVLAVDPGVPDAPGLVAILASVLAEAGVASVRAIGIGPLSGADREGWPESVPIDPHEPGPDAPDAMAYLASTQAGRRVYLNRALTEADVVVPVGLLGFDGLLGYRGPWSTLFPGLSDDETRRSGRAEPAGVGRVGPALDESSEVSWLLGSMFQVGILPGRSGAARVLAGEAGAVRAEGIRAVDDSWTFRAESRAELVIAGVGPPGRPTTPEDLAAGLTTAAGLVRRGGKIALLSRAEGPIGPALQRLSTLDDPARAGAKALRDLKAEPDGPAAVAIAEALSWADVYLLSRLDDDTVDGLAMIPLGSPEEAERLSRTSPSCLVVGQADRTRPVVIEED